ncbi:hypothetical protein HWV07_05560 [Natronomonas salina]|uniref:hypothetical protein n=1 Tax=Natronomonas salina TaxID=1710540 RepID=UPI0015B3E415|nr:hypothetical protein [Natronomonas salina]QLD88526.1 hypothetical protein HWV07_05560 [Natronomonas salina]
MTDPVVPSDDGFLDFFRRYAKTWVHAVAAAGLTAFSTLTVVHTWFAGLAIAAYVVPPVALYLSQRRRDRTAPEPGTATEAVPEADENPRPDTRAGTDEKTSTDEEPRVDDDADDAVEWTTADAPVDVALYDAAVGPTAAYAVGESGVVLADRGEGWTVALEDGPGADGQPLRGVDTTADGGAVWLAGDSGSLGRIDVETGRHVDFSAPKDITDNWVDVAVDGGDGSETVLLVNGSGQTLRGRYRDGEVAWTGPEKPGSGSSFSGVDFAGEGAGYLCDTNDGVYGTTDAGETFERVGIDGADGTLTGVAALARDDCLVCADDGVVHRYDGARWTPESVGDALRGIAGEGAYVVACGEGALYERPATNGDWERPMVPASGPLRGVGTGAGRAVAVGDGGTVATRRLTSR